MYKYCRNILIAFFLFIGWLGLASATGIGIGSGLNDILGNKAGPPATPACLLADTGSCLLAAVGSKLMAY